MSCNLVAPASTSVKLNLQLSPSCHSCRAGFATSHPAAGGARPPAVRTLAQPYTAGRSTPQRRMKILLRANRTGTRLRLSSSVRHDLQSDCPGFHSGRFLSAAMFREIHRLHLGSFHGVQEGVNVANGRNPVPFVRFCPLPCVCGGFSRSR